MDDREALARLIGALHPWLGELVVVGGWAHQLHRAHALAHIPRYQALRTRDADLAFALEARLQGDIAAALKAAGFKEELSGDHSPPVSHYRLGDQDEGFYAEFLAPLAGSGTKRNGAPDATVLKAGVTAQKLRYLEVLLVRPWSVQLETASGVPVATPVDVRVANAVSFIAQKLLMHRQRKPDKMAQDVLYIHDTLELFAEQSDTLRSLWLEAVAPALPETVIEGIQKARVDMFGALTDVIRSAARIPQDRSLRPERVQQTCEVGLGRIFGDDQSMGVQE